MAAIPIGALIAISAATTVASTGLSLAQASRQNDNIRKAEESQRKAAEVQKRQIDAQAAQSIEQRRREGVVTRGRLAALSAESGGGAAAVADLIRQQGFDTGLSIDTIRQNLGLEQARVDSGLEANLASLDAQTVNPLIAGLTGLFQGASTGLSLSLGLHQLSAAGGLGGGVPDGVVPSGTLGEIKAPIRTA